MARHTITAPYRLNYSTFFLFLPYLAAMKQLKNWDYLTSALWRHSQDDIAEQFSSHWLILIFEIFIFCPGRVPLKYLGRDTDSQIFREQEVADNRDTANTVKLWVENISKWSRNLHVVNRVKLENDTVSDLVQIPSFVFRTWGFVETKAWK